MWNHRINIFTDGTKLIYKIICFGDIDGSGNSDCGCNADFKDITYTITEIES